MDTHVANVVLADNPWMSGESLDSWFARHLPERFVPRKTELSLGELVELVVGPRQVGKSTLVWKTLADKGAPFLYLNCEEPSLREWMRSPSLFVSDLKSTFPSIQQVFLEEAQHLEEAGLFLKGVHDAKAGISLVVTGSSSFHLEARTRESLAGRARRQLLLPFSIEELAGPFFGLPELGKEAGLKEIAAELACFGGYPTVRASIQPEVELARLLESFVLRDASDRFRIQHVRPFRMLLELAAGQAGSLTNFSEWAWLCGISRDAVRDYLQILEDTHILRQVRPYVGGKRSEITGATKVYFLDNGFRNRLSGGFAPLESRPDRGPLMENLVFAELAKTINPILHEIHYWRSRAGAEVDFILLHDGRMLPIEVKSSEGPLSLTRSMHSFMDAYAPDEFVIAAPSAGESTKVGSTWIHQVAVHDISPWVRERLG